jgi:hypothetical protein
MVIVEGTASNNVTNNSFPCPRQRHVRARRGTASETNNLAAWRRSALLTSQARDEMRFRLYELGWKMVGLAMGAIKSAPDSREAKTQTLVIETMALPQLQDPTDMRSKHAASPALHSPCCIACISISVNDTLPKSSGIHGQSRVDSSPPATLARSWSVGFRVEANAAWRSAYQIPSLRFALLNSYLPVNSRDRRHTAEQSTLYAQSRRAGRSSPCVTNST